MTDSTNATFRAEPVSENERRRLVEQASCGYDHSGVWCRKCGYQNPEAVKRERDKAAAESYARECLGADRVVFNAGFEAGYAYANELLKNFYALGAPKLP